MHTLSDQAIEVLVVRSFNAKVAAADVVDGLIVDHETAVGVLKGRVGGQDRVVRFNDRGRNLRGGVDTELKFALLAIVHRQTFHEKSTKPRASATTEGVEDKEALETSAVVGNTANLVEDLINELLANGIVSASIVV